MHPPDRRRRRPVLIATAIAASALLAACTESSNRVVTDVSVPPRITTSDSDPSATATTLAEDVSTTAATTTTVAPTTTYPPPTSGPPSSIEEEYVTGGGRRPRTPCEPGPDLGQLVAGANCRHLTIDGMTREYVVYVPPTADRSAAAPLVVFAHTDNSDGDEALRMTGWKRRADDRGMVIAFPTALEYDVSRSGTEGWKFRWNGFHLTDEIVLNRRVPGYPAAAPMPADDVEFIEAMIDDIAYQWTIDEQRVFIAGVKSGADLAMRAVVELPGTFAAVAIVADGLGTVDHPLPEVTRSVPTLMVIGTDDEAFAGLATTSGDDPAIPLDQDEFVASDVGQFVLGRLAALTGTDPSAAAVDDEAHRTTFTMTGAGIGGGSGVAQLQVVHGLADEYPSVRNNLHELIGTVAIANFFAFVAPASA